jgi:hypothetical protein
MLSRKHPATAGRKAKVKKAKTKNFALVKPAAQRDRDLPAVASSGEFALIRGMRG